MKKLVPMGLGAALVVLFLLPGCFRSVWLGAHNKDLEGEAAPALEGGTWIRPDGKAEPVSVEGRWRLLAFFLPT
ncbi:MAG: hypothetical protein ACYSUN_06015 [Planctomycetota bacterium]|jgi:hypothetical protein